MHLFFSIMLGIQLWMRWYLRVSVFTINVVYFQIHTEEQCFFVCFVFFLYILFSRHQRVSKYPIMINITVLVRYREINRNQLFNLFNEIPITQKVMECTTKHDNFLNSRICFYKQLRNKTNEFTPIFKLL